MIYEDAVKAYNALKKGEKIPEALSHIDLINVLSLFVNLISWGDWGSLETSHAKACLAYSVLSEHAAALSGYYYFIANGICEPDYVKAIYVESYVIHWIQKQIYENYEDVLKKNQYNLIFWLGIKAAEFVKGGEIQDFASLATEEEDAMEYFCERYNYILDSASRMVNNYRIPTQTKEVKVSTESGTRYVLVKANSTVTNFKYNATAKQISFTINGVHQTIAKVDITVPKLLVSGSPHLMVYVDGKEYPFTSSENSTAYFIHLNILLSEHIITISFTSETAIPLLMLVYVTVGFAAIMVCIFIAVKWKRGKVPRKNETAKNCA